MLITEQAYQKSLQLLRENSTSYGFVAAGRSPTALQRGYNAVFARDAMICAWGALAAEDEQLLVTAKQSLSLLAKQATSRGQIPFSVNLEKKIIEFRVPHSLDSTLWWLILFWLLTEVHGDKKLKAEHQADFERSLDWLHYSMNYGLLEQGEGADWADEMPRSGLVLYTNALWLIFAQLIDSREKHRIFKNFEYFFSSQSLPTKGYRELDRQFPHWRRNKHLLIKPQPYYLAAVSRVTVDESFDILGNSLAGISGLVPAARVNSIIAAIKKCQADEPVPVRVLAYPAAKKIQGVFEASHQNKMWHYHNAGAWPLAGGFWIYLLAKYHRGNYAQQQLTKLAEANFINNWEFNEWFHGKNGRPLGVKKQSWNAASYILAYQALMKNKFII